MKIVNNKMNFTEAVDLITLMTKFAYNIDGEGFEKMYKEIGLDGGGYAMENFHKMQNNFSCWWNGLDRNIRICIVDWVLIERMGRSGCTMLLRKRSDIR